MPREVPAAARSADGLEALPAAAAAPAAATRRLEACRGSVGVMLWSSPSSPSSSSLGSLLAAFTRSTQSPWCSVSQAPRERFSPWIRIVWRGFLEAPRPACASKPEIVWVRLSGLHSSQKHSISRGAGR
jgi:hypothetical protein